MSQIAKSRKHLQAVKANPALKVLDAGSRCIEGQKRRDQEKTELHGNWEDGGCGALGVSALQMPSMHEREGHVWGGCGGLEGQVLSVC